MSPDRLASGYLSRAYAEALSDYGTPRSLAHSGGWLIERPIPGTGLSDAMGTYPLTACRDWAALASDLEDIGSALVSIVCVTDPFGGQDERHLRQTFPDLLIHYKDHFIVDLGLDRNSHVHATHRRKARKALASVDVTVANPAEARDIWVSLYSNLIARHGIRGVAAFSSRSLRLQLDVPGATLLVAKHDGKIVGATLWYRHVDVAYYHLGAYSDLGYTLQASFALFWRAMDHFSGLGLRALDIGAAAGLSQSVDDGLSRFKRGWSNRTLPVFLAGRILDPLAYRTLADSRVPSRTSFFPAYRGDEAG